jgi:alkylation response protein AidB-like acyl-CoA dehydrogenase
MDFRFSESQAKAIREARDLAERELRSDRASTGFDREAFSRCADAGVFRAPFSESEGGAGLGLLGAFAVFEALGRGGADRGALFAMGAHLFGCALPLSRLGSDAQRDGWVPRLQSGQALGALAITEADVGSNPSRIATTVRKNGNSGYLLSGEKTLITNAPDADVFLVVARQGEERGAFGLSAFVVPRDTPGLEVFPLPSLGLQGAPVGAVRFTDCALAAEQLISGERSGFSFLLSAMQYERTCLLSGFLGAAERDLASAVEYTRKRKTERGSAFDYQAVAHRLARVSARLELARLAGYRGAWAIDAEKDAYGRPALTKLALSEAVVDAASEILKTFAGAGWLDHRGVGRALTDVVGTLSASGTSDVQLDLIASRLSAADPCAPWVP